jgi:hypothetical protein
VAQGNRNPSEAGIRLGNEKFVFISHNPDTNSAVLSRTGGGGAVIAKTGKAIIIGIYHPDEKMSNGEE